MLRKTFLTAALSVAAVLAAGTAQARDADVSWTVTIGSPGTVGVSGPAPRMVPVHGRLPAARRGDADGDGIPNHRDRLYNPAWDVDGDGIPNRYDRRYNPPHDRDGDGIPNRWDSRPNMPRQGNVYGPPAFPGRGR